MKTFALHLGHCICFRMKAVPLLAMKAIWDRCNLLLLCHLIEIVTPDIKIWKLFLCLLWKLFETNTVRCCFVTLLKFLCQSSRSQSCSFATPLKAIWDKHNSLLHCHMVEIIMLVIKIWKLFLCYTTESYLRQTQFIVALSHGWNYYASHQDLKAVPLLATPLKAISGKHVFVAASGWNCYNSHQDLKAVPLLATPVKTIWHKHALLLLCESSRSKSCSFAHYTIESCSRQMGFVATLSPQWKWNCYTSHQDLYLCACLF